MENDRDKEARVELLSNEEVVDEEDEAFRIKKTKTRSTQSLNSCEKCVQLPTICLTDHCTSNEGSSVSYQQDNFKTSTLASQTNQVPQQPQPPTRKISRFTINEVSQLPYRNLDTSLTIPVRQPSVRFDNNQINESNSTDVKPETVNLKLKNAREINPQNSATAAAIVPYVQQVIHENYRTTTEASGGGALALFAASVKVGDKTHDNDVESLGDLCLLCPREHLEGEMYEWLLPVNSTFHSRRLPCNCTEMRYVHMECLNRCGYIQQKTTLICPWCKADLIINRKRHTDCDMPKLLRHTLQLCLIVSFVMVFVVWSFVKEGVRVLNCSLLVLCCLSLIIFIICKLHTIFGHYDYAIYRPRRSTLHTSRSQKNATDEKSRVPQVV